MYPHHLLYTTNIKPIEILRGKFDSFPSLAVITINIIFYFRQFIPCILIELNISFITPTNTPLIHT